jgi:Helix-turn-helix domain
MNAESLEGFVDAEQAARFLFLTRRHVLELARAGKLPGHPIGDGARRVWRFRLSELAAAVSTRGMLQKPETFGRSQGRN